MQVFFLMNLLWLTVFVHVRMFVRFLTYIFNILQPVRKKKQFIDKKNAITFHLVHRSQKDPLQASEEASKHVLVPEGEKVTL